MQSLLKCDRCHSLMSAGMTNHQAGVTCRVKTSVRKLKEKGFSPVNRRYESMITMAGIPFEIAPVAFKRGHRHRVSRVLYAVWVPNEVAEIILSRTSGVASFAGRVNLPLRAIKKKLRAYSDKQRQHG